MLVSEILAIKGKVLFTVASNKTLVEAVAVMTEQDVGSLVVFDKGRMAGLLTFREVLMATQKAGADWQSLPVSEAMLKDPVVAALNYRENGWTLNQVVHHCADSHMNFLLRLKLALSEDHPTITPYDEALWAEMPDYQLPFNNSITVLFCIHAKLMLILRSLQPEQLDKTYFHPQYKRSFSIRDLIALYSWHGNHHLAHINSLKTRMNW